MNILTVFGTRPEAIKLAPVIRELKRRQDVQIVTCSTGQHRQMLDQVLNAFGIIPDIDMRLMEGGQSLAHIAATVLSKLDPILEHYKPDWVLVQGDTTTVAAAALGAFYRRCKVGHIEAGLRSYNRTEPFPEEVNRCMATVLADFHFAPTEQARRNLLREGVQPSAIEVTGNTVIDALRWASSIPYSTVANAETTDIIQSARTLHNAGKRIVLITAHRRENFGEPLENICCAIEELACRYADSTHFFYPLHLNPHIRVPVRKALSHLQNVTLCAPLDYFSLIAIMKLSYLILTDSGGIQEEAPSLGIPVLVLRETTERPEAVEAGTVRLVGSEKSRIISETIDLFENQSSFNQMNRAINPYGDGHAAERIANILCEANSVSRESGLSKSFSASA